MVWKSACHGELNVKRDNALLVIEGTGPWNIETLLAANSDAEAELNMLYQNPWGVLSIMHGEAAYLPDASHYLTEQIHAEKSKNRVATALVVSQSNLPTFSQGHLGKIYQDAGENYAFFDNVAQARDWLEQQIAITEMSSKGNM